MNQGLSGKTGLLVDVSGSMDDLLSMKGETRRIDAASGLSILLREKCELIKIATFSEDVVSVPPRRGFALRDAVVESQAHSSTYLKRALTELKSNGWGELDRVIVITDEQSHDAIPDPLMPKSYMINVASYRNGVGYYSWTHIDGWSESVVRYITELEKMES